MKKILFICLLAALLALAGVASAAAGTGTVTGSTHTHGTERAMKITSDQSLSTGGVSWDITAPKNTRPSLRADIYLIGRQTDFAALPDAELMAWYQQGKVPADAQIYYAQADDKGAYRFSDVPAGDYYLLTLDPYGKEFDEGPIEREAKEELFAKLPHEVEFELYLVGVRTCLVQKIQVAPGEETHVKLAAVRF